MHDDKILQFRSPINCNLKTIVLILFVFSTFIISNDDTFKIASMNASSIVSMLMVGAFILEGFVKGQLVLQKYPLQKPLFLLFLWALVSLLISKIGFSRAIPDEAYSYVWATGLNSPDWRGISFLLRLFFSIFAIDFIISNINTEEEYFRIINYFLVAYFLVCIVVVGQMILFYVFKISIGHVFSETRYIDSELADYSESIRFGGYVGEPSSLAALLVSGYFPLIALIMKRHAGVWFSRSYLRIMFIISTIGLLFTFSGGMDNSRDALLCAGWTKVSE